MSTAPHIIARAYTWVIAHLRLDTPDSKEGALVPSTNNQEKPNHILHSLREDQLHAAVVSHYEKNIAAWPHRVNETRSILRIPGRLGLRESFDLASRYAQTAQLGEHHSDIFVDARWRIDACKRGLMYDPSNEECLKTIALTDARVGLDLEEGKDCLDQILKRRLKVSTGRKTKTEWPQGKLPLYKDLGADFYWAFWQLFRETSTERRDQATQALHFYRQEFPKQARSHDRAVNSMMALIASEPLEDDVADEQVSTLKKKMQLSQQSAPPSPVRPQNIHRRDPVLMPAKKIWQAQAFDGAITRPEKGRAHSLSAADSYMSSHSSALAQDTVTDRKGRLRSLGSPSRQINDHGDGAIKPYEDTFAIGLQRPATTEAKQSDSPAQWVRSDASERPLRQSASRKSSATLQNHAKTKTSLSGVPDADE